MSGLQVTGGSRSRRVVSAAMFGLALAALVLAWWFAAPPQLGGRTSYVTVVGTSMEPDLHSGDLVAVRPAPSYEVGDVVAYRSPSLRAVVLHRIVDIGEDGFHLRGDANDWVDSDRPGSDQIVGEMAFRMPMAGRVLAWLRSVPGMITVVAVFAGVAGLAMLGRRRGRREDPEEPARGLSDHSTVWHAVRKPGSPGKPLVSRTVLISALVFGIASALALLVSTLALSRPRVTEVEVAVPHEQSGVFAYTADAPEVTRAYGPDGVQTGDPIYLRLATEVDVTFEYAIGLEGLEGAQGTIALAMSISDTDGWGRTFELAPPASFEGGAAAVAGTMDLARLRELVRSVQRETGVQREGYSVDVLATVKAEARASGDTVPLEMEAILPFVLDELELRLFPGDDGVDAVLAPTVGDVTELERAVPSKFSVGPLRVEPGLVGEIALVVAGLCLFGLIFTLVVGRGSRRRAEHELIAARYGRRLIKVEGDATGVLDRAIDVESIETLVLLAGHYDQVILHGEHDGHHLYFFRDGGVAYCYRSTETPSWTGTPAR